MDDCEKRLGLTLPFAIRHYLIRAHTGPQLKDATGLLLKDVLQLRLVVGIVPHRLFPILGESDGCISGISLTNLFGRGSCGYDPGDMPCPD